MFGGRRTAGWTSRYGDGFDTFVTSMTYTPDPDSTGRPVRVPAAWRYARRPSTIGRVLIDVQPAPDAPIAHPDTVDTLQDQPITIDLLANDTDDDPWSRRRVEPFPSFCVMCNGTWVINADNTVTYTPTPGYVGTAAWDYSLFDADGPRGDSYAWVAVVRGRRPRRRLQRHRGHSAGRRRPGGPGQRPQRVGRRRNPEVVDARPTAR